MKMKSYFRSLGWTAATISLAGITLGILYSSQAQMAVTVHWEETGDAAYSKRGTTTRRMDGSMAERSDTIGVADRSVTTSRVINDRAKGTRVTVSDATQTTVTIPINAYKFDSLAKNAKLRCGVAVSDLPTDQLLGFEILKVLSRESEHHGLTRGLEVWAAPALDCMELKKVEYVIQGGRKIIGLQRVAVSVTKDYVDQALFEIPGGYREVTPSEQIRLRMAMMGGVNPTPASTAEKLDASYHTARKKLAQ